MSHEIPIEWSLDTGVMQKFYIDETFPTLYIADAFEADYMEGLVSVYTYNNSIMYVAFHNDRYAIVIDVNSNEIDNNNMTSDPVRRHVNIFCCTPISVTLVSGINAVVESNVHIVLGLNNLSRDCKLDFVKPEHSFIGIRPISNLPFLRSIKYIIDTWITERPETNPEIITLQPISRKIISQEEATDDMVDELCIDIYQNSRMLEPHDHIASVRLESSVSDIHIT